MQKIPSSLRVNKARAGFLVERFQQLISIRWIRRPSGKGLEGRMRNAKWYTRGRRTNCVGVNVTHVRRENNDILTYDERGSTVKYENK